MAESRSARSFARNLGRLPTTQHTVEVAPMTLNRRARAFVPGVGLQIHPLGPQVVKA